MIFTKYLSVFCMGFFGLLAQALLFRTFLITFDGNEMSIGLFFFAWLIWVCIGAWIARIKPIAKLSQYFHILILFYLPCYILQQYLFINAHAIIGSYSFELVSLRQLIPFVLLFNAPVSFVTGFLFVLGSGWMEKNAVPVVKIYICESFGSFIGALLVTVLLFMGYPESTIFLIAASVVLLFNLPYTTLTKSSPPIINRLFRIIIPLLLLIVVFIFHNSYSTKWYNYNNRSEWQSFLRHGRYQGSFTTPQAKYLYGSYNGEFVVTSWNSTYETLPNTENASIISGEYLSQNPDAKKILVIGPGSFSICKTFSKLEQIKQVVWLDTDPNYSINFLKVLPEQYKKSITKIEVPDNRDIRKYVQATNSKFDLVVLNIPKPSTLLLNKYFSVEFFKNLKNIITPSGVVGINFPAGANYLGTELTFIGSSLLYTLRQVFNNIILKPGDKSCFFAAKKSGIVSDSGMLLQKRLASIKDIKKIFIPDNIRSYFEENRIAFQMNKYESIIKKYPPAIFFNTDKNPKAFLYTLLLTIKKLGNVGFSISELNIILQIIFPYTLLILLIYFILRLFYYYCYNEKLKEKNDGQDLHKAELYFAVFVAAISGLGINLVLIFLFQIYFGSVFLYFGLITALFMLGLFISGWLTEKILAFMGCRNVLCFASISYLIYIFIIYFYLPEFSKTYFGILFLCAGLFSGPFFTLAAFSLKQRNVTEIQSGTRLEAIDNFGGAIGSILCSIILLPIIGIVKTLAVMICFWGIVLFHSILLRQRVSRKISKLTHVIRIIGFILFGIILLLMLSFLVPKGGKTKTISSAWELTKTQINTLALRNYQLVQESKTDGNKSYTYYAVKDNGKTIGYIFRTKDFAKNIHGFAGPIHMLSYVSANGKIQNFTVLESDETPNYLNQILKSKNIFLGQKLINSNKNYRINAITGATVTSSTISRVLFDAGTKFFEKALVKKSQQAKIEISKTATILPLALLVLFTILAIIIRNINRRWIRYCFLIGVVAILGVMLNLQYSTGQVYALTSLKIHLSFLNTFLFLCIAIPVLIMIFGNIYCGYLCPFGAFQEFVHVIFNSLLKRLGIILPKLNKTMWQLGRTIKYIILFILLVIFILTKDKTIPEGADILPYVFSFFASSNLILYFIIFLIVVSLFYKRFWCRVLCPSGAFLALFNAVRLMWTKPKIQTANCDLGVTDKKDFDCICCDNCHRRKRRSQESKRTKNSPLYNYFFVFLAIVSFYYILFLLHENYNTSKIVPQQTQQPRQTQQAITKQPIKFSTKAPSIKSIGQPKNINMQKYKSLINQGRLSNHPAMYWEKKAEQ